MTLRVVHVVVTDNFAGVERYVATTARELETRGCDVAVVGGKPAQVQSAAGEGVEWLAGSTVVDALRSLARLGRRDVCHAHMTIAEATAIVGRPLHRASIVSTRHFATPRGSTPVARILRPLISASLAREIAASQFIASQLEPPPDAVLQNGVPPMRDLWRPGNRVVVVLQRLEEEKDTLTALEAWSLARMWEDGWSLRIVGSGSQRRELEQWVVRHRVPAVSFAGWVSDVEAELATAGLMLATARAEPFGLGVLEAMGAGVPVVAAAAGGHLETAARVPDARTFPPGNAPAAAEAMRSLTADDERARLSVAGRELVQIEFSVSSHVDRLLDVYASVAPRPGCRTSSAQATPEELVVCSLEPWDEVWRRNQFFVDILLKRNPKLRVLFVEPPVDPIFDLSSGRRPHRPRFREVGYGGRLRSLRPLKPLPRRAGPLADAALRGQVRMTVRRLNFSTPTLWINDVTYAPLIRSTGWPSVYDVTDDWLAAPFPRRELARLKELEQVALTDAAAVTVCSRNLADSRGRARNVTLIPNAVDVEHFRRPRPRPEDLPACRAAVYVGTLHESRLDVELVSKLARALPSLHVVLVGPDSLNDESRRALRDEPNVSLLGARPYEDVPAYLQHADVIVVPHLVNDFTNSLDPIKAYECLAVGVPTVAVPVAGFRELDGAVRLASREDFAATVASVLEGDLGFDGAQPSSWDERVDEFERILREASRYPA